MIKFIHIADLHANKERKSICLKALSELKDLIIKESLNGISPTLLFAGDFWDATITNTDSSGFTDYIKAMKEITDITDVYMITGTASHDPNGSYDIFETIGIKVFKKTTIYSDVKNRFNLLAIPEPRKNDYIGKNTKEISKNIISKLKNDIENFNNQFADSNLPKIMMYHGEVGGAVYQNGITAGSTPDSYAIPSNYLKGFDYCALGHIHKPQHISGTNAYYSGSVPARNFGEEHQQGVNLVTIDDNNSIKVEKIYFDFPVNCTEEISYNDIASVKEKDFSNKKVHLKITLDKILKKTFNSEFVRNEIQKATNAVDVKISFDYSKTSNIRSEKIAKSKSVIEKFKVYADINGINYKDTLIDKIKNIQDNMLIDQFIPCDSYSLEYLSLRGAIGIKDGTGKDEIEINFNQYADGILALVGTNGSGKTTIIENCHPFPQMLTRGGSLKEHFFLKDSHRILIYKTSSGKFYKISMIIDGAAKCIGTKYFVEVKNSDTENWLPYKSVDGSFESYKEWVLHTFGTVEMFLRTSFFAKEQVKGIPDLSRATKSEKMELFSILAGIDYLSIFSEQAKIKGKEINEKINEIKSSIKNFDELKEKIRLYKESHTNCQSEILKYESLLKIDKEELELYKIEQNKYDSLASSLSMLHQNLKTQYDLKSTLQKQYDTLVLNISQIKKDIANKDVYQQQKDWYENNLKKREDLRGEVLKTKELLQALETQHSETNRIVTELIVKRTTLDKKISQIDFELNTIKNSIPKLDGLCPLCGSPLSEHKKVELENEISEKENKIKQLEKEHRQLSTNYTETENHIQSLDVERIANEISAKRSFVDNCINDIDTINSYIETLDLNKIDYILNDAEDSLRQYLLEKKEIEVKLEESDNKIIELEELNKNQPKDYSDKIKRLERGINDSTVKLAENKATCKLIEKELSELNRYSEEMSVIEEKIKNLQNDTAEYSIIEKAFSNSGIQVLELDSAAPEISDIANSILLETYGDRFSISFETQRESSGKKIDDFIINIFDSESGRVKKLDALCSGESVWIKQALYYAFSILRTRKTGFCFRTRFLDESDGSLDSVARCKYIKMIEAAHKACNARLTVLITHSSELKDIIEQQLQLTSLRKE